MLASPVSRDDATAEFFDGTARGEFLIQKCAVCGQHSAPQAEQCHNCGSTNLSYVPAGGDATVVSWVVAHGRDATRVLVIGQLAEGPWWWSQIADAADDSGIAVGTPLRIAFESAEGSEIVPVFQVVRS